MAQITRILDNPVNIISTTTTKIVNSLEAVGDQSFEVRVFGLNINTHLNMYVDGKKVLANNVELLDRPGTVFSTDRDGKAHFRFFYREDLSQLINIPEAKLYEFINKNTGRVLMVVVDKASIDTAELPSNYKQIARCFAEIYVDRSYTSTLSPITDVIVQETTR